MKCYILLKAYPKKRLMKCYPKKKMAYASLFLYKVYVTLLHSFFYYQGLLGIRRS